MKVCAEPGCPTLTPATRCTTHTRDRDRARGTRQERGYGREHEQRRAAIQRQIDEGHTVQCWRCRAVLLGRAWHLDHTDDRADYRGPTCVKCNLQLARGTKTDIAPNG